MSVHSIWNFMHSHFYRISFILTKSRSCVRASIWEFAAGGLDDLAREIDASVDALVQALALVQL